MSLKNKRVLITAGPTWVPIDNVRIISNIATGKTGILLASKLQVQGARVTLLLGPGESCCLNNMKIAFGDNSERFSVVGKVLYTFPHHKIRLIRFRFLNELRSIIKRELKAKNYDIVIHSAAVSDYSPQNHFREKIKSGLKDWEIKLFPTPKIIDSIKRISRDIFLVGFKFEPDAKKEILIKRAKELFYRARLDLVVANSMNRNRYQAYIINRDNAYGPLQSKTALSEKLIEIIGENL